MATAAAPIINPATHVAARFIGGTVARSSANDHYCRPCGNLPHGRRAFDLLRSVFKPLCGGIAMMSFATLLESPTGKDILAAARSAKYLRSSRATAKVAGKSCSFTPAEIVVHAPQALARLRGGEGQDRHGSKTRRSKSD